MWFKTIDIIVLCPSVKYPLLFVLLLSQEDPWKLIYTCRPVTKWINFTNITRDYLEQLHSASLCCRPNCFTSIGCTPKVKHPLTVRLQERYHVNVGLYEIIHYNLSFWSSSLHKICSKCLSSGCWVKIICSFWQLSTCVYFLCLQDSLYGLSEKEPHQFSVSRC